MMRYSCSHQTPGGVGTRGLNLTCMPNLPPGGVTVLIICKSHDCQSYYMDISAILVNKHLRFLKCVLLRDYRPPNSLTLIELDKQY